MNCVCSKSQREGRQGGLSGAKWKFTEKFQVCFQHNLFTSRPPASFDCEHYMYIQWLLYYSHSHKHAAVVCCARTGKNLTNSTHELDNLIVELRAKNCWRNAAVWGPAGEMNKFSHFTSVLLFSCSHLDAMSSVSAVFC